MTGPEMAMKALLRMVLPKGVDPEIVVADTMQRFQWAMGQVQDMGERVQSIEAGLARIEAHLAPADRKVIEHD